MRRIEIGTNEAGQRLDKFLIKYFDRAGKGFVYKMLRKKNFVLNQKKAIGSELLNTGDLIDLYVSDETLDKFKGRQINAPQSKEQPVVYAGLLKRIIYEDEHIIIYDKPFGMLSQAAERDKKAVDVNSLLCSYVLRKAPNTSEDYRAFKPSVCNRLDMNTSGLIIFAKTYTAANIISELIKNRQVKKYYLTVVNGYIKGKNKLTGFIVKNNDKNISEYYSTEPKELKAQAKCVSLEYRSLSSGKKYSALEVELITGRSHQIRVQLAYEGHFILGDGKYGDATVNRLYGLKHQLLCSYKLAFPKSEEQALRGVSGKCFELQMPKEFKDFMDQTSLQKGE